jgi:hypothetical protein
MVHAKVPAGSKSMFDRRHIVGDFPLPLRLRT